IFERRRCGRPARRPVAAAAGRDALAHQEAHATRSPVVHAEIVGRRPERVSELARRRVPGPPSPDEPVLSSVAEYELGRRRLDRHAAAPSLDVAGPAAVAVSLEAWIPGRPANRPDRLGIAGGGAGIGA